MTKYLIEEQHLYEIIEDYKYSNSQEREQILKMYMKALWGNANKRRFKTKTISFKILDKNLPDNINKLFKAYTSTSFSYYQTTTTKTDHYSLVHQKINNLYSYYFDVKFCVNIDYFQALRVPKQLYYEYIQGVKYEEKEIREVIAQANKDRDFHKMKSDREKMSLSWREYKKIIEGYMKTIFENYSEDNNFDLFVSNSNINEDNRVIKYICTSLQGYMKNYQKEYYGISRGNNQTYGRCVDCGAMFVESKNKRKTRCDACNDKRRGKASKDKTKKVKCSKCNKLFEVKIKDNKTTICPKCKAKQIKTVSFNMEICTICGKEFIKSKKARTNKCSICYDEYRKKSKLKKK